MKNETGILPVPTQAEVEPVNSTTAQRQATLGANYQPRPRTGLPDFPAWNLSPAGPWNYAVCVSEDTLKDVRVDWNPECVDPLDAANPALGGVVQARRVRRFGHWREGDRFCRGKRTLKAVSALPRLYPTRKSCLPDWPPSQRKSR